MTPFRLWVTAATPAAGGFLLQWSSVGDTRYRLQYRLAGDDDYTPLPRPLQDEMDSSPEGSRASMIFTDDFTLTPPPDAGPLRWYRVRIENE